MTYYKKSDNVQNKSIQKLFLKEIVYKWDKRILYSNKYQLIKFYTYICVCLYVYMCTHFSLKHKEKMLEVARLPIVWNDTMLLAFYKWNIVILSICGDQLNHPYTLTIHSNTIVLIAIHLHNYYTLQLILVFLIQINYLILCQIRRNW